MELLTGFGHDFFRGDSLRPTRADVLHAGRDFFVPSRFDVGRGKTLDAGDKFLR